MSAYSLPGTLFGIAGGYKDRLGAKKKYKVLWEYRIQVLSMG